MNRYRVAAKSVLSCGGGSPSKEKYRAYDELAFCIRKGYMKLGDFSRQNKVFTSE